MSGIEDKLIKINGYCIMITDEGASFLGDLKRYDLLFFKNFYWTNVHFVEPLIAPVLDFVCPSSWVSTSGNTKVKIAGRQFAEKVNSTVKYIERLISHKK